jgi:hypothetical protein
MDNDRNVPVTKGDIEDIRAELVKTMRDSQTELLKAFYNVTESNHQRVNQLEGNQAALLKRIGVLEDRLLELERRIIVPKQRVQ